jgi:hypothetical protein
MSRCIDGLCHHPGAGRNPVTSAPFIAIAVSPFIHAPFDFPAETDPRLNRDAAPGCACAASLVTVKWRRQRRAYFRR